MDNFLTYIKKSFWASWRGYHFLGDSKIRFSFYRKQGLGQKKEATSMAGVASKINKKHYPLLPFSCIFFLPFNAILIFNSFQI